MTDLASTFLEVCKTYAMMYLFPGTAALHSFTDVSIILCHYIIYLVITPTELLRATIALPRIDGLVEPSTTLIYIDTSVSSTTLHKQGC